MSPSPSHRAESAVAGRSSRTAGAGRLRRTSRLGLPLLLVLLGTSACGVDDLPTFGFPDPVTLQARRTMELWQGTTTASLVVGVFVWGLIFWSVIVYRRKDDTIPRQVQYNLPVEILYTTVPIVMIAVLFVFTYRTESYVVKESPNPDVSIGVTAFRWGWQFEHVGSDVQVVSERAPVGSEAGDPTLVLPTDETIRFTETSPDVVHSFFVPAFLFKRDVIPGRINNFELTIDTPGTYRGRCAELCGQYHSQMNFWVKAVSPEEYQKYLDTNKGTLNGVPVEKVSLTTGTAPDTTTNASTTTSASTDGGGNQ